MSIDPDQIPPGYEVDTSPGVVTVYCQECGRPISALKCGVCHKEEIIVPSEHVGDSYMREGI